MNKSAIMNIIAGIGLIIILFNNIIQFVQTMNLSYIQLDPLPSIALLAISAGVIINTNGMRLLNQ